MTPDNIRYLYHAGTGIELIFCDRSAISYPLHNHVSVLTIGIVLDGSIVLTTNQGTKTYAKNQIFVISPYVPHSISTHKNYTLFSLCINKNMMLQCTTDTIRNHIITLLTDFLSTEKISQYQILQLLNRLNTLADYYDWRPDNYNPLINNLKKKLELYPESKLSIEKMAQNTFISKYHFIRSFKAEAGLTPHQFQLQNRIRKTQRLLHKTETITEAALTAGFCDQSHFIKQFKKYVGLPPLAYKLSSDIIHSDIVD